MVKKSNFIKNLLTTASAVAVLAGGTQSAMANSSVTINAGGRTDQNHYNNEGAAGVAAAYTNGNTIIVGGAHDVDIRGVVNIPTINAFGNNGQNIIVNFNGATIGNIVSDVAAPALAKAKLVTGNNALAVGGGGAAAKIGVAFAGNDTLSLTANDITALNTVDFANNGATFKITGALSNNLNFGAAVTSAGGNNGTLEIDADNVTLSGAFSAAGTSVNVIKIDANRTATADTELKFAQNIELGAGSTLNINAGKNITSAAGDIKGAAPNNGTLNFKGASVVTATIGNGNNLLKVGIGAGTVELNSAVYKATTTEFSDNVAALKLTGANAAVVSNFTTTIDGKGKIIANAGNQAITGNFGAAGNKLEAIEFAGNTALTLKRAAAGEALDLYVNNITAANGNGTLSFQADTVNVFGNIGANGAVLNQVAILQNALGGGASAVTLKTGSKVYATSFEMAAAAHNNTLTLEENSELHANVNAVANANNGIIIVKGTATINGSIGAGGVINKILFDTADKTLNVTKNNIATNAGPGNGIDFTADGTLNLTEVNNLTLTTPVLIGNAANGQGSIKVNGADNGKTVEIQGTIGDFATVDANTKALKLLEVKGGANIKLTNPAAVATAGAYIKKIDIGDKDVKLILSDANAGTYKILDFAHQDGKGTVEFADNTTLKAGTKLSAANNKLNKMLITGDRDITFEDGIDIYTGANGIQTDAAGSGLLIFKGGSVVDAAVGTSVVGIGDIQIEGGATKIVDFKQDVTLSDANAGTGTITLFADSTAIFRGNVKGAFIDAKNAVLAGEGTINFANSVAKEVDLEIGQVNVLNTIVFSGTDVKFNKDVSAKNMSFTKAGPTTATFVVDNAAGAINQAKINGTAITTTSTTRQHNIKLELKDAANAGTVVFQANNDIATEANQFGNFIIDKQMTVNVNTTNFLAGVTTVTAGKGKVDFIKNGGATTLNLGDEALALESVTFSQNGTVRGVLNATTVAVNGNRTATLKDSNFVSGAMTVGADSTADFKGDAIVAGTIAGTVAGKGKVLFDSSATITGALSGLQAITFSSADKAKIIALDEDLSATTISFGAATVRPTDDVTLTGASAFVGTNLDLSNNKNVTLTGGNSTISGNVSVAVKLASAEQASLGKIIVDGAASSLNASGVTGFQVNVTEAANVDLPGVTPRTFDLISKTNGATLTGFGQDKVAKVTGGNKFAEWTFNATTGKLTQTNNAAAELQKIVGTGDANLLADAARIGDARNVGDARAFQTDLGRMTTAEQVKDALGRLSNPIITAADAVGGAISGASQMTQNRIGELSPHPTAGIQTSDASGITGVSAGDGDDRTTYGAWVSPFYNVANQSAKSGVAGYKSTSYGATIGADTMTNADMSLGVALSYLKTDVKHKNIKSGDKTKADTYMFSVYGIQQLTNDWFLQGVATFSSSKIKNSEKRGTSTGYQVAKGEYDATSYGTELLAGYLYSAGEVKVTPLGGIAVSRFNDGGYKETGTTSQNLSITRKAMTKFEGILGARVEMANVYAAEGMELVPELHAYVRHDFLNQNAKVTTKLDGLNQQFTPKAAKANKTMFNLGTSLNSKAGMYEYGAGYDLNLSSKYVGHQGTVKVRVNF